MMRPNNTMKITLEQIAELLKKHSKFVVTAHVNPDGDALGSVLALSNYLISIGKNVTCLIDDDIPSNFSFLNNIKMITSPVENKINADLLIVLDSSDLERIGRVRQLTSAPVLNIDHHISNNEFADYLYLDSNVAATGEIIFQLFKLMDAQITVAIAEYLYTAIATDSGFFKYSNTSESTMKIAAELIHYGVKPNLISEELEKKPLSSIRALPKVLETLELFANNRIACISITQNILELCDSTEGFIDFPRVIDGVELAIMIKYVDDSTCRISMRSKTIDVSKIATSFGGGGHKKAAGCTIHQSLLDSKKTIVDAASRLMGVLNND
ncbi:MAG: phosphoesterase RecJ domain protein [Massilibacillus sp.]|nr:phosphoesterase RecJ domain protein [Massilibacillus sp.]